jgi:hypothetical protein
MSLRAAFQFPQQSYSITKTRLVLVPCGVRTPRRFETRSYPEQADAQDDDNALILTVNKSFIFP